MAELRFGSDPGAAFGFDSSTVQRESVSDESVIRELVQNSLDATKNSNGLKVFFCLSHIPRTDIPHISEYEQAFFAARSFWSQHDLGPTSKACVTRIEKMLDRTEIPCLVCSDDGEGIDPAAIRSLYGEGATTKPGQGRGSVGKGHLTAFSPSDLRLVLYAGRHAVHDFDGRASTFGAHAVLATHRNDDNTEQYSPHGYVMPPPQQQESLFVSDAGGVPHIPPLLDRWLPDGGRTGSAVVIVGYRPLSGHAARTAGDDDIRDMVFTSVVKNFTVALHQGDIAVAFGPPGSATRSEPLDKTTAAEFLRSVSSQQRRTRGSQGPAGRYANRVWQTLDRPDAELGPEKLAGEARRAKADAASVDWSGVRVWFRKLKPSDRSRVFVFRDGMWITDTECPSLRPSDFGGCNPFEAVVDFKWVGDGSLADLIRNAEGASHIRVRPREMEHKKEQKNLTRALKQLRNVLRDLAGDLNSKPFVPDTLKLFNTRRDTAVAERPKRRHRPTSHALVNASHPEGGHREETSSSGGRRPQTPAPHPKPRKKAAPAPGSANDSGTIFVPSTDGPGREFRVAWDAPRRDNRRTTAEFRMALRSGSDETSDSKKPPEWLPISEIVTEDGIAHRPQEQGAGWVRLPDAAASGEAVVRLSEPVAPADVPALILDLVWRQPPAAPGRAG